MLIDAVLVYRLLNLCYFVCLCDDVKYYQFEVFVIFDECFTCFDFTAHCHLVWNWMMVLGAWCLVLPSSL